MSVYTTAMILAASMLGFAQAQHTAGLTTPGTNEYPNLGYRHVGSLTEEKQVTFGYGAVHPTAGFGYFGTYDVYNTSSGPGRIHKIDLQDFRIAQTLDLDPEETFARRIRMHEQGNALIAEVGANLNGGSRYNGTKLLKLDAGTLERLSVIVVPGIFDYAIDPRGTGSMLAWDDASNLYTIDLESFTIVRRDPFDEFELVLDVGRNAYYHAQSATHAGKFDLHTRELLASTAVPGIGRWVVGGLLLPEHDAFFWGIWTVEGNISRIDLDPFSYGGSLDVPIDGTEVVLAAYDDAKDIIFVTPRWSPRRAWAEMHLVKPSPMTNAGTVPLYGVYRAHSDYNQISPGIHDPVTKANYFPAMGAPGQLLKVTSARDQSLNATRIDLPEPATIQEMRFYSHVAEGNIRFALYNDAKPKSLLWQSPEIANTVEEGEIIVPIADGEPPALNLAAGTYWAAFQIDTRADVPSYTAGGEGEGWVAPYRFGPAPLHVHDGPTTTTLPFIPAISAVSDDGLTTQTERWTQYVTYDPFAADQWVVE